MVRNKVQIKNFVTPIHVMRVTVTQTFPFPPMKPEISAFEQVSKSEHNLLPVSRVWSCEEGREKSNISRQD